LICGTELCRVAVDENVAFGRGDEEGRQVFASDVIEISGDAVGREGFAPLRVLLGKERSCQANG
jgi:hypothetical protein